MGSVCYARCRTQSARLEIFILKFEDFHNQAEWLKVCIFKSMLIFKNQLGRETNEMETLTLITKPIKWQDALLSFTLLFRSV